MRSGSTWLVGLVALFVSFAIAQTGVDTFTCPQYNNTQVTDTYGNQYIIGRSYMYNAEWTALIRCFAGCGFDTSSGNYNTSAAVNSFNDCFLACSNTSAYPITYQPPGFCDAVSTPVI